MKFSTTSLVHRAVCYFKTNTDATPVEFVYCCAMRSGAIIPLASARGITFNNRMDHRRTNFCKLKAKERPSNRRRFSLRQFKHTSLIPYRQFKEQQTSLKTKSQQQQPDYTPHTVRLEWSRTARGVPSFWNKEQRKQKCSPN
jgi:hypothetical protein